jgi:hypothetical protein
VNLRNRIPVEPLDDQRLVNIERRIVANAVVATPAPRLSRYFVGFAAVAAAVMVALVVGWKLRGAPEQGDPIAIAPAPTEPVHVRTVDKKSVLDIGDAQLTTSPGTDLEITRPDGGVLVAMAHGEVELEVVKRKGRPPFVVRAGDTDVIVVGTHFTVGYDAHVEVRVTEGVVKVVHAHHEVSVFAGSSWRSDTEQIVAMVEPGEIQIDPHTTPEGPDHDLLRPHIAAVPDTHHETPKPSADGSAAAALSTGPKHTLDDPKDPNFDLKTAIRAQIVLTVLDVGTSDPKKAIGLYTQEWSHNTANSSKALYSTAVVQAQRLGREGDALSTLDMYIRRYENSPELSAALWLRVRILCLRKLDDSCRSAAAAYLKHPGNDAASHVADRITMTE